jgi:hypothetical protein
LKSILLKIQRIILKEGKMNIRYVAKDVEWSEAMKEQVRLKVAVPLQRQVRGGRFDLSVHVERRPVGPTGPEMAIWLVLQTFDGRSNQIVRREGCGFEELVGEASLQLAEQVTKAPRRLRRLA